MCGGGSCVEAVVRSCVEVPGHFPCVNLTYLPVLSKCLFVYLSVSLSL